MFFSLMVPHYFTTHWTVAPSKKGLYIMNPEIVNLYIERLLKEIEELTKNRLLIETQLRYTENLNASLQEQINQFRLQQEKQNKKLNKGKEVDTSDTF